MSSNSNKNRRRNRRSTQRQHELTLEDVQDIRREALALGFVTGLDPWAWFVIDNLLDPTDAGHHHLTLTRDGIGFTTGIDYDKETGDVGVDNPVVIGELLRVINDGDSAGLVLRSVTTDAHHQPVGGETIRVSHVRGWRLEDGDVVPLTAGEMFSAMNTSHETGEPLSPEPGVECLDAHDIFEDGVDGEDDLDG